MGFIQGPDTIGNISQNAGIITLAPSLLTIGGQQYRTVALSRTIATDVALVANTLYIIYAVNNSGSIELRISANMNSVGPAGFLAWAIVGAFYASGNAVPVFGSLVTITGTPTSQSVAQGPVPIIGSTSNPTKGVVTTDLGVFTRIGEKMIYTYAFVQTSGGSNGNGNYLFGLPFTVDMNKLNAVGANLSADVVGTGKWGNATIAYTMLAALSSSTQVALTEWSAGTASNLNFTGTQNTTLGGCAFSGQVYGGLQVTVPVLGWLNTQLKDL